MRQDDKPGAPDDLKELLRLQRMAGNDAVSRHLGQQVMVQRHPAGAGVSVNQGAVQSEITAPPPLTGPAVAPAVGETGAAPTPTPAGPTPTPAPTGPAPAPATQTAMEVATAQTVLQTAYGRTHTIVPGNIILLADRAACWAKYDEINLGRHNPYTNAPWVAGDAQRNIPGLEGFADSPTIYVNRQTVLPTATAHEMLHINTASDFRGRVGETVNEGSTEHFAQAALTLAGVPVTGASGAEAYPAQRGVVDKLITLVTEATLQSAYFGGADGLINTFEELKGPGSWAPFKVAAEALNTAEVDRLVTTPAESLLVDRVNAIFNKWWVSDADIARLTEIYNRSGALKGAVRTAIEARIKDLWSIGQRTQLRVLIAS